DRDRRLSVGDIHHAVVDDRLRLLAPIVVEAKIPNENQTLDGLLVDLFERAVALLVITHAIGEDVVGRAAVAVFLEIVEGLRRGPGAKKQQSTRGKYERLHERRSLICRS